MKHIFFVMSLAFVTAAHAGDDNTLKSFLISNPYGDLHITEVSGNDFVIKVNGKVISSDGGGLITIKETTPGRVEIIANEALDISKIKQAGNAGNIQISGKGKVKVGTLEQSAFVFVDGGGELSAAPKSEWDSKGSASTWEKITTTASFTEYLDKKQAQEAEIYRQITELATRRSSEYEASLAQARAVLEVGLPKDRTAHIAASTKFGDISLDGIFKNASDYARQVRLKSEAGSIKCGAVCTRGDLAVSSKKGNITAAGIEGYLKAQTVVGNIESAYNHDVLLTTAKGKIEISQTDGHVMAATRGKIFVDAFSSSPGDGGGPRRDPPDFRGDVQAFKGRAALCSKVFMMGR